MISPRDYVEMKGYTLGMIIVPRTLLTTLISSISIDEVTGGKVAYALTNIRCHSIFLKKEFSTTCLNEPEMSAKVFGFQHNLVPGK